MKNFIVNIQCYFYRKNRKNLYKGKNYLMYILCNVIFRCAGIVLFLILKIENFLGFRKSETLKNQGNVIISLTTFPKRVGTVWMTIESLFNQSVQPREIRLYLTKEEFPGKEKQLPKSLLRYVDRGLKIYFVDNNLMPHNKYFYVFQDVLKEKEERLVVTVDDDMYYRFDMLKHLLNLHESFPNCVCANSVHTIKPGHSYNEWIDDIEADIPSHKYLALGVCGVLYPVKMFTDKRMYDESTIRKYCLRADDLWLKAFELINSIPVVTSDLYISFVDLPGTQSTALNATNTISTSKVNNDSQWKNLNDLFNVDKRLLSFQ